MKSKPNQYANLELLCLYFCAYHCAQLSYTTQHRAVLIISLLISIQTLYRGSNAV